MDRLYRLSTMKRMFNKMQLVEGGCVEWTGYLNWMGYGVIRCKGKSLLAHRLSYMFANNTFDLTSVQHVCHTCDNPKCVNPEHLWLGNMKKNMEDKIKKRRHHNQKKTHCKYGHEFTGSNLYIQPDGKRVCRTCNNIRGKKYYEEKKEVCFG